MLCNFFQPIYWQRAFVESFNFDFSLWILDTEGSNDDNNPTSFNDFEYSPKDSDKYYKYWKQWDEREYWYDIGKRKRRDLSGKSMISEVRFWKN